MKNLSFILFFSLLTLKLLAQKKDKYIFIDDKEKYVLSEKIKLENNEDITLNSLLIWQKDRAIRIVFVYEKRLPAINKDKIAHLQLFNSFIPTFKNYTIVAKPTLKNAITYSDKVYGGIIIDKPNDDFNPDNYSIKLKTAINNWNNIYNPLADKFGAILISDDDPEVMFYNEKRKDKPINNLPLLFNSTKGDTSYLISPLVINVYRLIAEKNASHKNLNTYKLYSTVSFLEQSVIGLTNNYNNEAYKLEIGPFIKEHTLQYLSKATR